jgi:hypothetical protein
MVITDLRNFCPNHEQQMSVVLRAYFRPLQTVTPNTRAELQDPGAARRCRSGVALEVAVPVGR